MTETITYATTEHAVSLNEANFGSMPNLGVNFFFLRMELDAGNFLGDLITNVRK